MDKIYIEDLQVKTIIGIYDWERVTEQIVSLNIEMLTDNHNAAATDAIENTVNYKKIAKRLIQYISQSRFQLIETLAERVAEIVLYEFQVTEVRVRLNKPGAVRYSRNVGIEINRKQQPSEPTTSYLSIGSNIDPKANIRSALAALENEFGQITASTTYQNPAVGFDGDDFLNLAVALQSALPPTAIAVRLSQIEAMHGRDRQQSKFSARSLDLDLLLYGDHIINNDKLILPRRDITKYAFVLRPLAELAPQFMHPTERQTLSQLWKNFPDKSAMQAVKIT